MAHVFTVQEITQAIKEVLEGEFSFIWVKGQIGNISRPGSGHIYFTIKDQNASLNIVWFKSNQIGDINIDSKLLDTGLEVICAGRLAVYPPKGAYQLIAELVQDKGLGKLHLEFEAMKKKLLQEGLFAQEKKKELPVNPQRIGLVTSPSGAAIKDFLSLGHKRGPRAEIRIYPSLVQGEGAVDNLVQSLEMANLEDWAQVIVLIRGGGSLEDLWSFNEEAVARSIFASNIPVMTGIGHEVDLTIADLVADLRAATPSHAAQLLWTEKRILEQQVDDLELKILRSWQSTWQEKRSAFLNLEQKLFYNSPSRQLDRMEQNLAILCKELDSLLKNNIQFTEDRLENLALRLLQTVGPSSWRYRKDGVLNLKENLNRAFELFFKKKDQDLEFQEARLKELNPFAPLKKGYSLVTVQKDGSLLKSSKQVGPGDRLTISTYKDKIPAVVQDFSKHRT